MKKSILTVLAVYAMLSASDLRAQSHLVSLKNSLEPYGFFRTLAIFDSRDNSAGSEDLFYYLPYDKSINDEGQDIYSNPSFKMYAITTRLGVDVKGYQYGSMKVFGKLEADFYLMNGSTASLRLRQAYVDLRWDGLGYAENWFSMKVGQAWHPLAADMPYCVNIESGSPFNPFNRSPQLMMTFGSRNGLSVSAGALYPMQYLPTGPVGPSEDYIKYGLIPELYAGLSYSGENFTARAGADFISLRPRYRTLSRNVSVEPFYDKGTKVHDRISMVSPFVYFEFAKGLFKVNCKSVLASGGDHLRLMGGYALYDWRDPYNYKYTPLRSSTSFVSFSYGRKFQFMCMGGYMMALGTGHNLPVDENGYSSAAYLYYFSGGFKNINSMFRVTPTLAYNFGKLTLALEYDNTTVQFGDISKLDNYARPLEGLHPITNHRVLGVVKYNL